MTEGYLRKWTGIMQGWKTRYFVLHDGLLSYCETKGGKRRGAIALKIATVSACREDPLRLIIHTGTNEIHLRADDVQQAKKWRDSLQKAKNEAFVKDEKDAYHHERGMATLERELSPETKVLAANINLDSLKEKIADVWCCQAEFDEMLSLLAPKTKNNPSLHDYVLKLEKLGRDLKVTECVSKIEEERNKVVRTAHHLDRTILTDGEEPRRHMFSPNGIPFDYQEQGEDGLVFHSFESDDDDCDVEDKFSPDYDNIFKPPSRRVSGINLEGNGAGIVDLLSSSRINSLNPLVKKILTQSSAFLETRPIPKENKREKMPYWLDPNQKMNVWAIVKDMVGKDLSKFAVPVWLNEPLSMLQKLCEQLEYSRLLDAGSQKDDSCLRMAYAMGFAFSYYAGTIGRHKKPFNPILGETFEYVPVDGSFKFISEQVSHHPPISVGFADSANFQWWGDTQIKTSFKGTSIEATSLGWCHIVLKKYDDHIVYKRPVTGVNNLIIGTMYLENYGEMPFKNGKTGDTGQLTLKKRGWGDRGAYETEGWIKDKNGTVKYTLHGKWNSYLTAVDALTKQEIKLWERNPVPDNYAEQYCFSLYARQLNYLYEELVPKLPATDCRLRPDQRALEHGFLDLAKDEKLRLEEKQRTRRKELQTKGETHKARWFEEIQDSITNEKSYKYTGGYWECREKGNYGEVLDLFS